METDLNHVNDVNDDKKFELDFFKAIGMLFVLYYTISLLLFLIRKCCSCTPNLL